MQYSPKENKVQLGNSYLNILSRFVSWIFHPVFMPVAMVIFLSFISPENVRALDNNQKMQWLGNIIVNTLFFPMVATFLMKALGFIESIHMRNAKDRIIPLIATMIFYFWAYQVFKNINSPFLLRVFLLGNFWGLILVFLVNIFLKISMHTAAAGGAIGIVIVCTIIGKVNIIFPLLGVVFIAGLIGTARIILKAHKQIEIWIGYFVGILAQVAAYWFLM